MAFAVIFHDIGKPDTKQINKKTGYDQYVGHAEKSAEIFKDKVGTIPEMNRLAPEKIEYISELIRLHDTKYSKQGKCQNLLNDHPNGFAKDLIMLQYADIMGQNAYQQTEKLCSVVQFAQRLAQLGTPEQTQGLSDVIEMMNRSIEIEPQNPLIQSKTIDHTPATDKEVKIKDLWDLRTLGMTKHAGLHVENYLENDAEIVFARDFDGNWDVADIKIDGKSCIALDEHGEEIYNEEDYSPVFEERAYERAIERINQYRFKNPYTETVEKIWVARTADNQDVYINSSDYNALKEQPASYAHLIETIGKTKEITEDKLKSFVVSAQAMNTANKAKEMFNVQTALEKFEQNAINTPTKDNVDRS